MSVEMIPKENEQATQEIEPTEAPLMMILGTASEEIQRLMQAGEKAGLLVHCLDTLDALPPRSEFDPDIVVTTTDGYQACVDVLPVSFRSRLVRMVAEDDWLNIETTQEHHVISAQASVSELAFRLLESLHRIRQQAWKRLGLPAVGNQEALWALIPSTDWVTGLDNRLRFLQELQKNVSRSKRYKRPFCCLLVQFNNFETLAGEEGGMDAIHLLLEEVAGILEVSIRDADFLARMQDDLFGLLLPETDRENGLLVATRIENNLKTFQYTQVFEEAPSFSCGLSSFDHETSTADSLLQGAQRALEAKTAS